MSQVRHRFANLASCLGHLGEAETGYFPEAPFGDDDAGRTNVAVHQAFI